MWGQLRDPEPSRVLFHYVPNHLLRDLRAPDRPFPTNTPEQFALPNISCSQPVIQGLLHPIRHWHRPNVRTLPNQVHNGPVILPALDVVKHQINQFSATQTTTKQQSQDSAVPLAFKSVRVGKLPQRAGFFHREPIPKPHSQLFRSLHAPDAGSEFWAQESCVGCFIGQPSNCSQSDVDSSWCQGLILKMNAVTRDDSLVERQPRFRTVPADEIIDGTPIATLRFRRR